NRTKGSLMLRNNMICLTMSAAMAIGASHASASLLLPGGSLTPPPAEPTPVGPPVTSQTTPFTAGTFSGSITAYVFTGDTTSPYFGIGGLTFAYVISCDSAPVDADIGRLT